jgi:hypothetical protein
MRPSSRDARPDDGENRKETHMKKTMMIIGLAFAAASCAQTGAKISALRPGLTKSQVVSLLGKPDGYQGGANGEVLQYTNRFVNWNSADKADYSVTLHHGRVVAYGADNVRPFQPSLVVWTSF